MSPCVCADVNARNTNGNTALMLAAAHDDVATVKVLLAAGAETGIRNKKRERARDLAEGTGNTRVLQYLEQYRSAGTRLSNWF